jgi:hypothetical protein
MGCDLEPRHIDLFLYIYKPVHSHFIMYDDTLGKKKVTNLPTV